MITVLISLKRWFNTLGNYFKVAHLTFSLESRSNKQEEAKLIESVIKKPLFVARESNLRFSQALVAIPFSLVCYC